MKTRQDTTVSTVNAPLMKPMGIDEDSLPLLAEMLIRQYSNSLRSGIAETIAKDKDLTRMFLQSMGVPVPDGRPEQGLDVLRDDVVPSVDERPGARHALEREAAAHRGADLDEGDTEH